MNCTLLLVASLCAWSDPAPAPAVVAPPAVGGEGCAAPCGDGAPAPDHIQSSCVREPTLFERWKASFANCDCGWGCFPNPVFHPAPQYHYHPACTCEDSCKPGFLDKIKGRFARPDCGCSPDASSPDGGSPCSTPPPGSLIGNPYGPTPAMLPYLLRTM